MRASAAAETAAPVGFEDEDDEEDEDDLMETTGSERFEVKCPFWFSTVERRAYAIRHAAAELHSRPDRRSARHFPVNTHSARITSLAPSIGTDSA